MKRYLACGIMLLASMAFAQPQRGVILVTPAPSGPCLPATAPGQITDTNGSVYACSQSTGTWGLVSGSAGAYLPDAAHLLFDYQMLPAEVGHSYFTDYSTSEGSSVGVGNCPFLSSPNAPTWIATGGALFGDLVSNTTQVTACNIPAAANSLRTFIAMVAPAPSITTTAGPGWYGLLSSNGTTNPSPYFTTSFNSSVLALGILSNGFFPVLSNDTSAGYPCVAYALGSTGDSTVDKLYMGGIPVGSYISQGHTAGAQTTGNFQLGGISKNNLYFWGSIYRAAAWTTYLTDGQVYQACSLLRAQASNEGVPLSPSQNTSATNQIMGNGDSIMAGTGSSNPPATSELGQLSGLNDTYTVTNYGLGGTLVAGEASQVLTSMVPTCATTAAKNIAILQGGSNDMAQGNTAAVTWAAQISQLNQIRAGWKKFGCAGKIGIQTIISRVQIDSGGTNPVRSAYNTLARQQALIAGFDFVDDVAENALMGADGACSSGTYYSGDCTHPSDAGYLQMANVLSRQINSAYSGSINSSPNTVTASTYTQLDSDLLLLLDATSNNVAIAMTDCIGTIIPRKFKRIDSAGHTVTLTPVSGEPIDGASSTTLAALGTITLQPIANPQSTAGCHWSVVAQ